jgi:HEAT repeat protein
MLGGNREKMLPELMAKWLASAREECRLANCRGLLPQEEQELSDVAITDIYVEPWVRGKGSHTRRSEAALEELAYELVKRNKQDPDEIRKELANHSVTPNELKVAAATGHGELQHIVELLHLLGEEAGSDCELGEAEVQTYKIKLSQAIMDHQKLLLVGDPAVGKTAALRWIGNRFSTRDQNPEPCVSNVCGLVPLYAPLRELNSEPGEPRPGFKTWMLSRMTPGGSAEEMALTEEVVRTGQVIVLLDGLNEVIGARARTEVAEEIFDLFESWPQCRVVMTSRQLGYRTVEADSEWSQYSLLELDEHQAVELLERWLVVQSQAAAGQGDSQAAGRKLVEQLRSGQDGARLMRQPLMLTILTAGQSQGVRLPQRRTRVLHSAVVAMAVRLEPPPEQGAELHLMEVNRTVRALAYVGYKLHSSYWDSMATITELRTLLVEGFIQAGLGAGDARERAKRVCQIVAARPTLLVEQAPGKYGFFQLIFQEYLAGLYLASFVDSGIRMRVIREQLHTLRWTEVIGFAIAAAEPGVAGKLLQEVAEHRSRWEEHLGRDAMAAVRYLAELPDVNPEVRDEMILDLAWHCPELGVESLRRDAAQALSQLPPEIANVGRVRKAILGLVHSHMGEWRAPLVRALDPNEHRDLLLTRIRCRSARVRVGIAQALACLPMQDAEVRRALLAAVEDCSYEVRQAAISSLADLVAEDEEIRSAMLGCLTDRHSEVRAAAVMALASVAATDTAIRAALLEHVGDSTNLVREAAVKGLASLVDSNEYVKAALFERLEDWDENVCAAAVEALAPLAQEDENLRAAVLGSLRSNRWSARAAAVAALAPLVERDEAIRATLLARLQADLWGFRPAAVKVLTALAPALVPEVESIKASLAPHMESERGGNALTDIGDDPESLVMHLAHQDEQVRQAAVAALSNLVEQDQDLRAELIAWLRSEGKQVREAAIFALTPLVSSDEEVRSTLLSLHDDEQVIGAAVTVLANALAENEVVRSTIIGWLSSPSTELRIAALTGMVQLTQVDEDVQASLIDRFTDEDSRVRAAAVEALAKVLPRDDKLKTSLLERLEDEDETARAVTVRILASLFPTDEQVVSALRQRLHDESHHVATSAVAALTPRVAQDEQLRATLLERITSEQRVVGAAAVAALAALAPRDSQIRAALIDCLVDDSWDVRAAAVRALAPLATADSEIRDLLFDRLAGEHHSFVNSTTVVAMAPLVTSDQSIRSALLNHFAYHYDHEVRAAAVKALAPLAASDENVRSALLNRLTDRSPIVRGEAAIALATAPEEVQSSLIARLHDVTRMVRSAAAKAIGLGCGREGWPTAPVESLVWSAEVFPWVRRAALEALVVASHLLPAK